MPNIGPAELIVILLVALVVFGPRKLPELGKSLGHGLREFRRSTQGLKDDLNFTAAPVAAPAAPAPVAATALAASSVAAADERSV
ncbi:twin-arginine translocase TatA/TatE family subunit [Deinococcus sp. HMF7620]|uniref:Sec-independent protein translocase protein TatA n=1 Tax=Deinococcus arboris TaxID=2682977 RepID=A0A7C9I1U7_9DEIO|nr:MULTISPECIES: twin-arginine translocase TatA/TatE family subunit [Deinococcus]MBZ9749517.1 twin-arginine translocase TatA/TatE family subunit [Deinococcus betulae]MVN86011.1 twin-arginine translocase TatA/TatE family subunit [Deinococcus arboris]